MKKILAILPCLAALSLAAYAGKSVYYGVNESSATGKATASVSGSVIIAASTATADTPAITLDGTTGIETALPLSAGTLETSTMTLNYGNMPVLVASGTLSSPAAQLTISGLDSRRDGMYELCASFANSSEGPVELYVNGDTSASNYRLSFLATQNGTQINASTNSVSCTFFSVNASGSGAGCAKVFLGADGYPEMTGYPYSAQVTSDIDNEMKILIHYVSSNTISSITLARGGTNFGIGTKYSITKTPF